MQAIGKAMLLKASQGKANDMRINRVIYNPPIE
jgi:hypothetical protein